MIRAISGFSRRGCRGGDFAFCNRPRARSDRENCHRATGSDAAPTPPGQPVIARWVCLEPLPPNSGLIACVATIRTRPRRATRRWWLRARRALGRAASGSTRATDRREVPSRSLLQRWCPEPQREAPAWAGAKRLAWGQAGASRHALACRVGISASASRRCCPYVSDTSHPDLKRNAFESDQTPAYTFFMIAHFIRKPVPAFRTAL